MQENNIDNNIAADNLRATGNLLCLVSGVTIGYAGVSTSLEHGQYPSLAISVNSFLPAIFCSNVRSEIKCFAIGWGIGTASAFLTTSLQPTHPQPTVVEPPQDSFAFRK